MANRATSAMSRVEGLVDKVNELKEELEKAQVEREKERESGISTAKQEVKHAKECAMRAEAKRDNAINKLNSLRSRVAKANQELGHVQMAMNEMKTSF
ncbi:hypothetical protein SLEP1_g39531 [Rubroshorea leprosula]|uniref:Tropomyosin n=1 Tax=Rubroshorea leprosula TaxID=152421 RepID=A0AAV5L0W4_9ROSI|nr:hypothetical protein SLEP1_g39531 [Rubroshorea leprosula]